MESEDFDSLFKNEDFCSDNWRLPNFGELESQQRSEDIWSAVLNSSMCNITSDLSDDAPGSSSDDELTKSPRIAMEKFPAEKVTDIKHVIYNLMVDNYNNPTDPSLIQPFELSEGTCGISGIGFRFVPSLKPEIKLPELYSQYIRHARLDLADPELIFTQDLYRFYLRACLELLSKYFRKLDKWTYLFYDNEPLFVPGLTLEQAEVRVKNHRTIARKKRQKLA
jgi:hypothetical protein